MKALFWIIIILCIVGILGSVMAIVLNYALAEANALITAISALNIVLCSFNLATAITREA